MANIKSLCQSFEQAYPKIVELFREFEVDPILVGGVPRDFLLNKKFGLDFDIELQGKSLNAIELFTESLAVLGKTEYLRYNICRLEYAEAEFEFSPARIENFIETHGHSNFTAEFKARLDPKISFARRDLTINAIGVHLLTAELIDPFKGSQDLALKKITPVSPDFQRDPLRFIRAVRFKTNLTFEYAEPLLTLMKTEQLQGLNSHHFFKELSKAKNKIEFINDIIGHFSESFLKDFLCPITDNTLSIEQYLFFFYVHNQSHEYLQWTQSSPKNFKRAREVYENKGEGLDKLPIKTQKWLSGIL